MAQPDANPLLHMIGNAHLDPVWLWRWQEGCAEAIGTCWAAIDRLEEGDGFVFTKGEALIYDWIESYAPDLFERIRHYVANGRWVIVNGWWIQPDCNVPNGESVVRQALYGKRYFADRFGVDVTVGYNVDSFGHAGSFPMLLRHTGFESYVFMRPGPHEKKDIPAELFQWFSPDGSSVTAFRIQDAYNTSNRSTPLPEKIDQHFVQAEAAGHPFMCFYGVGNHGGAPTIENIDEITRRIAEGQPLAWSDPSSFFAACADRDLPSVTGELQFHAIGCYAVASNLKALNRRAEAALEQAETAAALAFRTTGSPYDRQGFATLWQSLLFNQFHDTLGGTSIAAACVDSERDLHGVIAGAQALLNGAVRQLDRTISPPIDSTDATFVVMNFTGGEFNGLIEVEPWVDKDLVSRRVVLDETGSVIAHQHISAAGRAPGLQRVVMPLTIPAFGYRTLRFAVDLNGQIAPAAIAGRTMSDDLVLETPAWRLEIDRATGAIASLVDKASGKSVFVSAGHRAIVVDDPTDTWSHGVDRFGFTGRDFVLDRVTLIEDGLVRKGLVVRASNGRSTIQTTILIPAHAGLPIEMRVRLDWQEERKLLRLAYPFAADRFTYEVPAGAVERPADGREVPALRWVLAEGGGARAALINDAKYSYAAKDGTLYITTVRSPVFAHHDPVQLAPQSHYAFMDQGPQEFTLRLLAGDHLDTEAVTGAAEQMVKPPVDTPHVGRGGKAAHSGQWLRATTGSLSPTSLKLAEDSDALMVRLLNLGHLPAQFGITGQTLSIAPFAIATMRIEGEILTLSDGLER